MSIFARIHTYEGQTVKDLRQKLNILGPIFDDSVITWEAVMKPPFDKEASIPIKAIEY